jgi:hypothetical protein
LAYFPAGHSLIHVVPSKNLPVTQVVQVEAPEQAKQGEVQAVQTSELVNVSVGHTSTHILPFNL